MSSDPGWKAVWAQLKQHNPKFFEAAGTGMECVLMEIRRLQALAHKAACPVCNPDMTVPQLNEAFRRASNDLLMRETAAALAHRGCCGTEHDAANGKLHGYCVVCGVPWPCETAQYYLRRADKPETTAPVVQYDPVGFQYLYTDPFTGNDIWKNESGLWNGQKPHGSREVYARTQLRPAVAGDST
jgi:hypothetical protein